MQPAAEGLSRSSSFSSVSSNTSVSPAASSETRKSSSLSAESEAKIINTFKALGQQEVKSHAWKASKPTQSPREHRLMEKTILQSIGERAPQVEIGKAGNAFEAINRRLTRLEQRYEQSTKPIQDQQKFLNKELQRANRHELRKIAKTHTTATLKTTIHELHSLVYPDRKPLDESYFKNKGTDRLTKEAAILMSKFLQGVNQQLQSESPDREAALKTLQELSRFFDETLIGRHMKSDSNLADCGYKGPSVYDQFLEAKAQLLPMSPEEARSLFSSRDNLHRQMAALHTQTEQMSTDPQAVRLMLSNQRPIHAFAKNPSVPAEYQLSHAECRRMDGDFDRIIAKHFTLTEEEQKFQTDLEKYHETAPELFEKKANYEDKIRSYAGKIEKADRELEAYFAKTTIRDPAAIDRINTQRDEAIAKQNKYLKKLAPINATIHKFEKEGNVILANILKKQILIYHKMRSFDQASPELLRKQEEIVSGCVNLYNMNRDMNQEATPEEKLARHFHEDYQQILRQDILATSELI